MDKTINTFMNQYGLLLILFLLVILFFRSCSTNKKINRVREDIDIINNNIDTLTSDILTESEMIHLIETVPAWNTLRIEEISDKERISINALEQKNKN